MKYRVLNSISFRITFWISLVVCIIVLVHVWTIQPGKRFYEQKMLESERLARVIRSHLLAEMMSGTLENIQNHLEFLPSREGIHRVEIIDVGNVVSFSTDPSRVGRRVWRDREAPCFNCHKGGDSRPERVVYEQIGIGKIFAVDHILRNGEQCVTCHEGDGAVLGNLLVEVTLNDLDLKMLETNRRLMLSGAGLLVVLLFGIAAVIHYFVGHPVARLVGIMRRVEGGDLVVEIPSGGKDEFGFLANAFRDMVRRLRDVYGRMEKTIEEKTRSLYETQAQVLHQEKLAGIGQLAAGVAHEIGNPLTAIDSMAQLLASESKDPAILDKVGTIQMQVARISEIVHNMADLSRPLSLEKKPVHLNAVVRSLLGLVRYDARFESVRIETELAGDLTEVETVEDRLFSVFLNLALNAADAMPDGGILEIRTSAGPDHQEVSFRDTGEGIAEENLNSIFEPYFTTKERGRGTGLGLAVCRTALREIGGDITVRSAVGKGSTFIVKVPLVGRAAGEGRGPENGG